MPSLGPARWADAAWEEADGDADLQQAGKVSEAEVGARGLTGAAEAREEEKDPEQAVGMKIIPEFCSLLIKQAR